VKLRRFGVSSLSAEVPGNVALGRERVRMVGAEFGFPLGQCLVEDG
jgi:hypothetical protein